MRFQVKDLLITVMPEAGGQPAGLAACGICTTGCTACSGGGSCPGPCSNCSAQSCGCTYCTGCTALGSNCTVNTCTIATGCVALSGCNVFSGCGPTPCGLGSACGTGTFCGGCTVITFIQPEEPVEKLAALKLQLRDALARVESEEKSVAESLKPQTVEQVDQLEKQLQAALDELRGRRDELARRAAEKGGKK
jgi:hypothetical protein